MENPIKMGWFGGKTHYFRKHPNSGRLLCRPPACSFVENKGKAFFSADSEVGEVGEVNDLYLECNIAIWMAYVFMTSLGWMG